MDGSHYDSPTFSSRDPIKIVAMQGRQCGVSKGQQEAARRRLHARPAPLNQPRRSTNDRYYDFGSGFIM